MRNTTEELFASALALPASERDSFLQRACGYDDAQISRIKSLLADSAPSAEFMNEADATVQLSDGSDRIDNYRLRQELGEGGCGTVYLAEQMTPIRREVAIKVIKLGMDTKAVVARFAVEQQALALMDHSNIARVLDAGATQTGRPYFVMEVVRGIKITDYCHQCRLTLTERLELFVQVCHAVQHAHAKGVIHRDIKPSNVLVTLDNGAPIVKVIDFGIAKAMHGRLTDDTVNTLIDQFVGTPAYVSPEHAGLIGELDARSDIYSLGVLLYELLTGSTPLDPEELLKLSLADARKKIVDYPLDRPSARLRAGDRRPPTAEALQRSEPKLVQLVRRDLDWIAMKCLEKDKERRYQTVCELVDDIRRFIREEPIEARPPSIAYALGKLARRHRTAFAIGSTTAVALVLATTLSAWLAIRAIHAERASQRAIESLSTIFDATDPSLVATGEADARNILVRGSSTIVAQLKDHPRAQVRLLQTTGRILRKRGYHSEALDPLKHALRIQRAHFGDRNPEGVRILIELGTTLRRRGYLDEADEILTYAESHIDSLRMAQTDQNAYLLRQRALIELELGQFPKCRDRLEKSLAISREVSGVGSLDVADGLEALTTAALWMDELDTAERSATEALAIRSRLLPAFHPDRLVSEWQLGEVRAAQGRLSEALALLSSRVDQGHTPSNGNAVGHASTHVTLATIYRQQKNWKAAEAHAREALQLTRSIRQYDDHIVAYRKTLLGSIQLESGSYAEAERELTEAIHLLQASQRSDHAYMASAQYFLGEVFLRTTRWKQAEQTLLASLELSKLNPLADWRQARSQSALGEALYRQGRVTEGRRYIVDSYAVLSKAVGVDSPARDRAKNRLTEFASLSQGEEQTYSSGNVGAPFTRTAARR